MRACVLACLATAATATRVLSGGGLPLLKKRTFGRRAVLPVPAASETMTVGDDRKLKLDFSRTDWRDILAAHEENGSLPTADQVPDELDWPSLTYPRNAGSLCNYLTHAEMMSLGLQRTVEWRNLKPGASQLHWNIYNDLVARKADYEIHVVPMLYRTTPRAAQTVHDDSCHQQVAILRLLSHAGDLQYVIVLGS